MAAVTHRLGVLGWPVSHSRSPAIQNAALNASGLGADWRYQLLPVPPELFAETVAALPRAGFGGANVTIPHKEAALELSDDATARAVAIGAANTLLFGPGGITADNTDAPGLIGALPFSARGADVLVLGAGGSARAAVWAFRDAGARKVMVWNRTPERAERLADDLGAVAVTQQKPVDFLVNCTAIGLQNGKWTFNLLPSAAELVQGCGCVIDLVYTDTDTELICAARERDLPVVTGLDVLIGQGALAFELFTGQPAPVRAMRVAVGVGP